MTDLEKKAEEMLHTHGVHFKGEFANDEKSDAIQCILEFAQWFASIQDEKRDDEWGKELEKMPDLSQNGWIDVKERLPEIGSSVLTYPSFRTLPFGVKENEDLQGDPTDYNFWEFSFNLEKAILVPNVTHWMPLPQHPKL